MRIIFQLSIRKYAQVILLNSKDVSWGGKLLRPNTFPVCKSVFETFLGSYGEFFVQQYTKTAMSSRFCVIISQILFNKNLSGAAEKRLKNTFTHRERVWAH